jgi:shikimate kinase
MADELHSSLKSPAPTPRAAPKFVCLVGFMGAGKTTVGQSLAARLGWNFIDVDDLVEAHAGRTIREIFEQNGEQAFRDLERRQLEQAVRSAPTRGAVLSLGGGAFVDNTNRKLLRENDIPTVFLDAPVEELFRRCRQPGAARPLLRDPDQFGGLYSERRAAYLTASFSIQTAGKEIRSVVEEIIASLRLGAKSGAFQ